MKTLLSFFFLYLFFAILAVEAEAGTTSLDKKQNLQIKEVITSRN